MTESRESELEEARRQKLAMEALLESFGWKLIVTALDRQIHGRREAVLQPGSNLDGCIAKEHLAGEAMGLTMALQLPQLMLNSAKDTIELLQHAAKMEGTEHDG